MLESCVRWSADECFFFFFFFFERERDFIFKKTLFEKLNLLKWVSFCGCAYWNMSLIVPHK